MLDMLKSNIIINGNGIISKLNQIGIVVQSVDKTAEFMSKCFGLELDDIGYTPDSDLKMYMGRYEDFCVKAGFFRFNNIEVELLEPVRGNSVWKSFLDTHGEGLHHLQYVVRSFSEAQKHFESCGIKLVQSGPSFVYEGAKWGYFDSLEQLGYYTEIYNYPECGYPLV